MHDSGLWQAVLGEIELSISRGNFVTWFKNTQLVKNKDDIVTVGVPNIFVKNQLEKKFNDLVLEVLAKNGVKPERVEYKIHTGIPAQKNERAELIEDVEKLELVKPARTRHAITDLTHSYRQGLNERY